MQCDRVLIQGEEEYLKIQDEEINNLRKADIHMRINGIRNEEYESSESL